MAKVKIKKKSEDKNPYKKVNSSKADFVRTITPLPINASQAVAKLTGDARMSESSLSDKQKVLLWDVIQNAMKRSGKASGGTEYEDFGDLGHGSKQQFANWFNRGNINAASLVGNSLTNEGFKLASTIGRGRYWHDDKEPGTFYYTDVYDWNPSEKNFKGTNMYQNIRNTMRKTEDKNLNVDKNEKYRMNFKLSKSEIDNLRRKIAIDDEKFRD